MEYILDYKINNERIIRKTTVEKYNEFFVCDITTKDNSYQGIGTTKYEAQLNTLLTEAKNNNYKTELDKFANFIMHILVVEFNRSKSNGDFNTFLETILTLFYSEGEEVDRLFEMNDAFNVSFAIVINKISNIMGIKDATLDELFSSINDLPIIKLFNEMQNDMIESLNHTFS